MEEVTVKRQFEAADYVVLTAMLAISVGIGLFYGCTGGKQQTTNEFLMANRNMNPFPVGISLVASFISAITVLGTPAENYVYGCMYWMFGFAYIFTGLASAYFYLPVFYNLEVTSAYEYLEKRFNKVVRLMGMVTFSLQMVIYMGIVIYAPSLALNAVTGLDLWGAVFAIGIVCTFYTTIGGMKAVLWTDVFQVTVMVVGFVAIIIKGSMEVGGLDRVWNISAEGGRIQFFDFNPDPTVRHTFWSVVIGGTFTWTAVYGVNQSQVQRYLTCGSANVAKIALLISTIGMVIVVCLACLSGLVMYAVYAGCDPLQRGEVAKSDQLIPYLVMDLFDQMPGLPGLITSAVFSAALSTVSSGLNSLAAVYGEDVVKLVWPDMEESKYTKITKGLAGFFGLLSMGMAVVASYMGDVLQTALSIFGMIGGPLLGLFSLGIFFPWANTKGAIFGLISGLCMSFWIGIGAQFYPPYVEKPPLSTCCCGADVGNFTMMFVSTDEYTTSSMTTMMTMEMPEERPAIATLYSISYSWYSAIAWLTVIVVGLIISFATGPNDPADIDPKLCCSLVDTMYCCLPEKIKKPLRCGVRYDQQWHVDDIETEYKVVSNKDGKNARAKDETKL
ncbi:sodium-coupled monocarboxylate transporter 1-like [Anneissia japonica]|uniref:sodium-coupled monocarboxylate transporter 1-like n=1 Tax=Anneissia japonica TaxID=1529436 RepID=UPI0014256FAC|nr:sodium-coupled monocarboxylate transporter 1-like [Anneissia japonica]